jgi:hypothetical protein
VDVKEQPAPYIQVGMDVGKSADPSVVIVDHPVEEPTGEVQHSGHEIGWGTCGPGCGPITRWRHDIRVIRALPLGMPYPEQSRRAVEIIVRALERAHLDEAYWIVDATGPGAAMVDHLRDELARRSISNVVVVPLIIGSGDVEGIKGSLWSRQIWASSNALMSRLRYKVDTSAIALPGGSNVLIDEMGSFEFQVTAGGRLRFGARAGRHDDCVFALALATLFDGMVVRETPAPWFTAG